MNSVFNTISVWFSSRDGVVCIATRYGLKGPRIESRWGGDFSAPIQTGSKAHPASCKMDTGSFRGKGGRGVVLTTHPHLVCRGSRKRVELYWANWCQVNELSHNDLTSTHAMPLPCRAALIHTCRAVPLLSSASAVSFVKVHVGDGKIRTVITAV